MKRTALAATALAALVAGCGGGSASEPYVTSTNPFQSSTLQFAVGIATLSYDGGTKVGYGLNTVETLRQNDGLSGVLYSVPTITGPTSFTISTSAEGGGSVMGAGADTGTNHITWSTLNQPIWTGPARGIKAATTGVFGYGLCPCNADAGPVTGTPNLYQAFNVPVYGDQNDLELFYGGPPAFPRASISVQQLGFLGYSLGFTDFAVQPKLGGYTLNVALPPNFSGPGNPTPSPQPSVGPIPVPLLVSSAVLASLKPLPAIAIPSFAPDGKGGGTVGLTVPSGVTETAVIVHALGGSGSAPCVLSHESDQYYTIVTHRAGSQKLVLADSLGETSSGAAAPSICPNEKYYVYAAGFDYPAYEAAYPQNLSIAPTITGPQGQADVTTSDILAAGYPE